MDLNKVDWELALIEANKSKINNEQGKPYSVCKTSLSILRSYGIGIWLYMVYLKWMWILSIVLAILVTPAFICNMSRTGMSTREQTSILDKFSLANQGKNVDDSYTSSYWPSLNNALNDSDSAGDVLIFTDVIYSFFFAVFIIIMNLRISNQIEAAEFELTFMNDFSVEIKGLPKTGFTDQELIEYLQLFGGEIVELSYSRYFRGILFAYKSMTKVNKQIRHYEILSQIYEQTQIDEGKQPKPKYHKILDQLYKKQMKLKAWISEKYPGDTKIAELDKLWAYAVYKSPKGKTRTIQKFAQYNRIHLWQVDKRTRKWRFWVPPKKNSKFLSQHKLSIKTAPDPTEIIWENLEVSNREIWWRYLIVFFIVFVVLFLGAAAIYILRIYKDTIDNTDSWENMQANSINKNSSNHDKKCYCSEKTFTMIFTEKDFGEIWNDYFDTIILKQLIIIAISMLLFIINEIIELIFVRLTAFVKYKYRTSLHGETTIKIFMIMYMNTGLMMSIVDLDIFSTKIDSNQKFNDTAKGWYIKAGDSLFALVVINMLWFCMINFWKAILRKIKIWLCKKRYVLHQDIVKLYEGVELNLPLSYARSLTLLFVCFTYCNAFPIMIYLLWIYCNWQYWMEKYMILRHYKIPSRVGTYMHYKVIETLPYWLFIHFMYSWWFYGSPGILENWWFDSSRSAFSEEAFKTRVKSRYGFPFLILSVILGVLLLTKSTCFKWYNDIREYLKGTEIEPLGIASNFNEEKHQMEKTGLITYDISKNPNYAAIIKAIEETDDIANNREAAPKPKINRFFTKKYLSDDELSPQQIKRTSSYIKPSKQVSIS